MHDRILVPVKSIVNNCTQKIRDGDNVMTFGKSSTVLNVFKAAAKTVSFHVTVVDSSPKFEGSLCHYFLLNFNCQGRQTIQELSKWDIPCTYVLINSLGVEIKKVNKVIIGASSILANGAVMSRVGTASVALMAHEYRVPVIVCAETYKFSDMIRLDSFVWNEIGKSLFFVSL